MGKTIRINGIDVPVIEDQLSGRDLKRMAGIPKDRVLVQQEADRNTIVADDRRIRVADRDSFTHHAQHSKASTGVSLRWRRVRYEAAQLAAGYPGLRVADDASYVFIPGFRLPQRWVPDRTCVHGNARRGPARPPRNAHAGTRNSPQPGPPPTVTRRPAEKPAE